MRVKLSSIKPGKKYLAFFLALLMLSLVMLTACGGAATKGWSGVVPGNNALFVGGMDGNLYAINPATGTPIWSKQLEVLPDRSWFSFSPPSFVAIYSTPAVEGNRVFAGTYLLNGSDEHAHVFGLNTDNGEVAWIYPPRDALNGVIIGGITVANKIVYVGVTDHKLYALDATTGEKKWEFTTGDQVWASPVVSGSTVYIGSFDKRMYALDAATGSEKWHFDTDGAVAVSPLVVNNTVFFGSYNRHFYALDAANGSLKWDFTADRGFWATPVAAGNAVFVPGLSGKVYVLDVNNGRELGIAEIASYISSSPAVVGDGAVIASPEGKLYLLSATNFNAPPFAELNGSVFAPVASANGTVYVHTWSPERLYALDTTGKQQWNPLELQKK